MAGSKSKADLEQDWDCERARWLNVLSVAMRKEPERGLVMDISTAIRELCKVHTLNDPETGFTVYKPLQRTDAYHEAWATLRRAIDLPTEPAEAAPPRLPLGETVVDLKKHVAGEKILR